MQAFLGASQAFVLKHGRESPTPTQHKVTRRMQPWPLPLWVTMTVLKLALKLAALGIPGLPHDDHLLGPARTLS